MRTFPSRQERVGAAQAAPTDYQRLAEEAERPRKVADHRQAWEQLIPVLGVNGTVRERIEHFAASKHISIEALIALHTRVKIDKVGGVELAWGYVTRAGTVTAVKFRPLGDKKRYTLTPSTFLEPLVIGNLHSLDWLVAEGETDAARLYDLVGDVAAILVLPAGAATFRREWANVIPRGATVALCHDADEAGDNGAAKAARILGGKTMRLRPPDDYQDWCDWPGEREAFLAIVRELQSESEAFRIVPALDFLARDYPPAETLLGAPETIIYLARGTLLLLYGDGGSGKSTLTLDAVAHLAAGREWLDIPVPRPARVLLVENEGAAQLFQTKLREKAEQWDAESAWLENVHVYAEPWGGFSFANAHTREALAELCDEKRIDLVVANPLFGVGGPGSGRPDETSAFIDWLKELGLGLGGPAVWLLHHENKLGQVSGDWNRQPDTLVSLAQDGDEQRTKLTWAKTRWANRMPEGWRKKQLLEWIVEHKGFKVLDVDLRGASDEEIKAEIEAFLGAHPRSPKQAILDNVAGRAERVRALLDAGVEARIYDLEQGPRGAKLHSLASEVVPSADGLWDDLEGNTDE
jgi:AAA domain